MEKTITISGQAVKLKATAAVPRLYRIKFRRDIIQDITALELVKGGQDIPHPQDRAEKRNEVLFILLPNDPRFRQRKFCQQLMDKSLIAGVLGAVFICVTAEIILKAPQQYDAACLLVPKERDGIVHPLL